MLGVRPPTLARWAREGLIAAQPTPGGHRRYLLSAVRKLLDQAEHRDPAALQRELDAVRLYDQGWSIRRVAAEFETSYGAMRRLLARHTTLRTRAGIQDASPAFWGARGGGS